ncbi:MAG: site specific recombinase [Deltaproteobacteria bacterium]|nr:site specific recombinase [Deltaproteobacteria bacterium]
MRLWDPLSTVATLTIGECLGPNSPLFQVVFASRLVMAGADLPTVKELMGHKTLAMTLRYSHLSTAHRVAAVRMLDGPAPGAEAGQTGTGSDQRCRVSTVAARVTC